MINPEIKLKSVISWINNSTEQLKKSLNVSDKDIDSWLKQYRAGQYEALWNFFDSVNTDIYGRFTAGTLTQSELNMWEKNLEKWRDGYIALLREYWHNKQKKAA
ncbi:hypothetical protein H8E88_21910 [candidate division KSB1 bacterium]|nr:hypothetical protein [candidate division KSB1 bacterium]